MPENPFVHPIPNQTTGFASPAETEREAPLSLDKQLIAHPAATFLLRSEASWPEYGVRAGDIIVVDRAWEPASGLVALGIQDGRFCLGRLQRTGRSLQFSSSAGRAETELWGIVCHVIHPLV